MMKSKKVLAGDSENEFDVDEPEEVGDHSEDEWDPTAFAKTPGKRLRPVKSTPARKKKEPKISYVEDEEEKPSKKERESKTIPPPPAPIPSSSRGRRRATKVLKVEPKEYSEDDEEVEEEGDEEEVGDDSEDEWASTAVAKTFARIKKESKVSLLTKKDRGSKAKSPPPAPIPSSSRGRGRETKVLIVEPEENSEDDKELNQGPNAKPAQKFTSGAFLVSKTDMIDGTSPDLWKIDDMPMLQRYIPFEQDGKVFYKSDNRYHPWGSVVKDRYYPAPVSFIKQINEEHIIEFHKDKIKKDPKVEEAVKRKKLSRGKTCQEEEAELADDDDEEE